MFELVRTGSAANADNVSNTMTVATAGEALKNNIRDRGGDVKMWKKKRQKITFSVW